jgi:hypothetical protein
MHSTYQFPKYAKYRASQLCGRCWSLAASSVVALKQQLAPGVLNVHRRDFTNIGDLMSSPFQYFRITKPLYKLDIEPLTLVSPFFSARREPLVLGGGGLFFFEAAVNGLLTRYRGPVIGWGIGQNGPLAEKINTRIVAEKFALLGVRDWQSKHEWVPCSSCLAPELDAVRDIQPEHDFVLYDHQHTPLPIKGHPRLSNACMDFSGVLAFLASGETVITNSYHGAYWARLLGRRVVVLPFSNRLLHMRFPPAVATAQNYQQCAKETRTEPGALETCRESNLRFASRVSEIIGTELQLIARNLGSSPQTNSPGIGDSAKRS